MAGMGEERRLNRMTPRTPRWEKKMRMLVGFVGDGVVYGHGVRLE
jgi:hypothetical protein